MSCSAETFHVLWGFYSEITLMKWNLLQSTLLIFILSGWKKSCRREGNFWFAAAELSTELVTFFTFPGLLNFPDAALEQKMESTKERICNLFQNLMVVLRPFQKLQLNCVNGCQTLSSGLGNRGQTLCSKSGACKLANRADTGDAVRSKLELHCEIRFI